MKVKTTSLFNNINDIRKYMSVDIPDEIKQKLAENLNMYDVGEINNVLNHARIYVRLDLLPETIEVET